MDLFVEIFSYPFLFPLFICRVGLVHSYCPTLSAFRQWVCIVAYACVLADEQGDWMLQIYRLLSPWGNIYTSKLGNEIGRLHKWNIDLPIVISLLTCKSWNYISELHSSWCKYGNEIQAFWRALVNQLFAIDRCWTLNIKNLWMDSPYGAENVSKQTDLFYGSICSMAKKNRTYNPQFKSRWTNRSGSICNMAKK